MCSAQVNVVQIYNICIVKRWVSLGEKYFYDRYGQRSSYSSSLKQLIVKSEILATVFIISTGSLLSLLAKIKYNKHRKRDFRYNMGLTSEKIWETVYELPGRINRTEENWNEISGLTLWKVRQDNVRHVNRLSPSASQQCISAELLQRNILIKTSGSGVRLTWLWAITLPSCMTLDKSCC